MGYRVKKTYAKLMINICFNFSSLTYFKLDEPSIKKAKVCLFLIQKFCIALTFLSIHLPLQPLYVKIQDRMLQAEARTVHLLQQHMLLK